MGTIYKGDETLLYSEILQRYPSLKEYTATMPENLRYSGSLKKLPAHYLIHQKDSPLSTIGILCEGKLKVLNEFDNGNAFMIEYNHPIDIIGDVTLLAEQPKTSVTIETVSPCTVWFFTREDFEYWMHCDNNLLRLMSRKVAQKLYNSSYSRGSEVFYSSTRLMLEFFRRSLKEVQLGNNELFRFPDTRQQLSEQLGMMKKTVGRTIKRCKENGLIGTDKGKITISKLQITEINRRLEEWI